MFGAICCNIHKISLGGALCYVLGRTFERILADKLREYLEYSSMLLPHQFDFRAGSSSRCATEPILQLYDAVNAFDTGKWDTDVFLDIKRAFEKV